ALATLALAGAARADVQTSEQWDTPRATRRSGFSVGGELGAGVLSIAGFPNDPKKIGYQSYYTETGVRPGTWLALWLGGAFNDWLSFGVGFGASSMFATDQGEKVTCAALLFHVEGFPFEPFTGGHLRDLGLALDAGTGPVNVDDRTGKTPLVEGGAASLVGATVFYEGIRFWRVGSGPFMAANYMFSDSARRPAFFIGYRAALYAGVFGR
ncbi:MAG TPA: hypothetical protein VHB21_03070, partial [Minicystis sp.]|nr:hypothetical protein [Minicystis sp.]